MQKANKVVYVTMQIANISSTLGSIGDKEQYMEKDDARRGNAFAVGGLAYKMSKAALNMRESIQLNCHMPWRCVPSYLLRTHDFLQPLSIVKEAGRRL